MLEFGPFRIDAVRRLLYRDETVVDVPPKSFSVLLALVERRGQVVTKEELMEAVWPGTAVEENNLARGISTLRKALGEASGENRYILTLPGRGYSFVAAESRIPTPEVEIPQTTTDELPSDGPRGVQFFTDQIIKGLAVSAAIAIATFLWISGHARSVDKFESVRLRPIFTSRQYPSAALSPDGKSLAYAGGEPGRGSVRLRQIDSGSEVELLGGANRSFSGLTFTADGRNILLLEKPISGTTNVLLELPLSGGALREIARGLDSPPAISPDGSQLGFVRETHDGESQLLLRRLADGMEERLVAVRSPTFLDYPVWSPDGQSVAYTEVTPDGVFLREITVKGRTKRRIGQHWNYIRRFAWLPGSDGFLLSAREPGSDYYTIWQVPRSGGPVRRVTESVDSFHSVTVSADGTRGMTVAERSLMAVWVGTPGQGEVWRELLPAAESVKAASWTTDGKILLERRAPNGRSIEIVSPEAKEPKQILSPGPYQNVRLCPDRRTIVYQSSRADQAGLWMTDLSSGRSNPLLTLTAEAAFECHPKDRFISFVSKDPRWWPGLWKIPLEGGEPEQVSKRVGFGVAISTDGKYAAYFDQDGAASAQRKATKIAVVSLDGSGSGRSFDVSPTALTEVPLRWIPGKTVVTYADSKGGASEIWGQQLSGGAPWQITSLSGGLIASFDWSPDGKQLVLSRGMRSFELLLLELGR